MNRYLEHQRSRPTHERRQHAMRVATVATAVIFVAWLATLGVRLASNTSGSTDQNAQQSQLANVVSGTFAPQPNTLQVVPASDSGAPAQ